MLTVELLLRSVKEWNEVRKAHPDVKADLREANLSKAELNGANLREANLSKADLSKANLRKADLSEAILSEAILSGAILSQAELNGAILSGADLSSAKLNEAILRKADLSGAILSGAELNGVILSKADLREANLKGVILSKADLSEAILSGADLSGADLNQADLSGANLSKANLSRANLRKAYLNNAYLSRTILNGADLTGGYLNDANLIGANLNQAILSNAILSKANLSEANLSGANLSGAYLNQADLSEAKLTKAILHSVNLSKCVINKHAIRSGKIYGCDKGVNGIYCSETDSAALMKLTPRGNSMHSSNPEAIIENLKGARKLHNITLSFAGICLLIGILKPKEIKLPLFSDFTSDQSHYIILAVLAVFLSIGIMSVAESFMRSALEGTQYINNQDAAMKVGHFPWMLSKYENGFLPKVQSLIMRTLLIFHPIVYIVVLYMQTPYDVKPFLPVNAAKILNVDPTMIWGIWSVYVILLALCIRIGVLSHKFQKPILFDPLTERDRKTDAEILNETLSNIAELLKVKTTTETAKTKAKLP